MYFLQNMPILGFCLLKLAVFNRFLPAGLNWSGRNQTTLLSVVSHQSLNRLLAVS